MHVTNLVAVLRAVAEALALANLQAQARQLATERGNLAEEQRQLAADVCRLEAHVKNHQLVTEARARREAADAAKAQQLEESIQYSCSVPLCSA